MYVPIGLFGVSIGTAVLPSVSRHAAVNDTAGIRHTVSRGLGLMLMLNVPATFGLIVLATPIVRLLFERGHFLPSDTAATAVGAAKLRRSGSSGTSAAALDRAFRRRSTPSDEAVYLVMVSAAAIVINVIASLTLVRWLGVSGLALGTSIAAVANAAVLVWLLRGQLDGLETPRLAMTSACGVAIWAMVAAFATERRRNRLLPASPRRKPSGWRRPFLPGSRRSAHQQRCWRSMNSTRWSKPSGGNSRKRVMEYAGSRAMPPRYSSRGSSFSFGPGPISTALKGLIAANVVMFVAQLLFPVVTELLGLHPTFVLHDFWIWQLATYMFLHGGIFHIVFNMLALWMFGAELERVWAH